MKILLDECFPEPATQLVARVLKGHKVDHVSAVGWSSKKDRPLLRDAGRQYQVFITNDLNQYDDPDECMAIKKSGLHHVTYVVPSDGLDGLALAAGSVVAAIRGIVAELESADSQRIARVRGIKRGIRHVITDPSVDPPSKYWPSRHSR